MGRLTIKEGHSLGKDTAVAKLKSFGENLKAEHGDKIIDLKENWIAPNVLDISFTASAPGQDVDVQGRATVEDTEVILEGKLPFKAMLFKNKIETTIRENLRKALDT